MKHYYTYLALGDSYTIGEGVAIHESYPYQLIQLLRSTGHAFHAPEIVAKTGWTTFELADNLLHRKLNDRYDFCTLLIGVNNQYRQLPLEEYKSDFTFLIKKAIHLAGESPSNVFVISIPDWGATPFAAGRDKDKIEKEINTFNEVNRTIAGEFSVHFIDITPGSREAAHDESLVAADKLHPSSKEYAKWAAKLFEAIDAQLRSAKQ